MKSSWFPGDHEWPWRTGHCFQLPAPSLALGQDFRTQAVHCLCLVDGCPPLYRKPTLKGMEEERLPPSLHCPQGPAGSSRGASEVPFVCRVTGSFSLTYATASSGLAGLPCVPTLHCRIKGPRTLGCGTMGLRGTLSCLKRVAVGTCTIRISLGFTVELKDIGRRWEFGLQKLPISTFPGPDECAVILSSTVFASSWSQL